MLKIYHSKQSRSMRVVWLCEEIGIPYDLVQKGMFTPDLKTPDYLAIHPLGKVPAIDDDGFVLWETSAIFDYLVARYDKQSPSTMIPPRDTQSGALAAQWMGFGENPLTVIMGEIAAHSGPIPDEMKIPALVHRGVEIAPALVRVVERALGDQPFILGTTFSAADIMLGFGLNIARHLNFIDEETPRVLAYCDRLMTRPAYQRAAAL